MAAEQHRGALITQLPQHLPDGGTAFDVEAHGGLIQHQHLGTVQQAGGQVEAPTHAPGIGAAAAVDPALHPQQADQLMDPPIALIAGQVIQVALQGQQLPAAENFVQRHLLGHVTQALADSSGIGEGIQTRHPHHTAAGGQQGGQDPQRGGLAGPVGSKQAIQAARRHRQIQALQGLHRPVALAVTLADVLQLNHRTGTRTLHRC